MHIIRFHFLIFSQFIQLLLKSLILKLIDEMKEREHLERLKNDEYLMRALEKKFESINDPELWLQTGFQSLINGKKKSIYDLKSITPTISSDGTITANDSYRNDLKLNNTHQVHAGINEENPIETQVTLVKIAERICLFIAQVI